MKIVKSDIVREKIERWQNGNATEQDWAEHIEGLLDSLKNTPDFSPHKGAHLPNDVYRTHPNQNKQLSIYFKIFKGVQITSTTTEDILFVKWLNDETCLHDTFNKQYKKATGKDKLDHDPCLAKFYEIKDEVDDYDRTQHIGQYRRSAPLNRQNESIYFEYELGPKPNLSSAGAFTQLVTKIEGIFETPPGIGFTIRGPARSQMEALAFNMREDFKNNKLGIDVNIAIGELTPPHVLLQHRAVLVPLGFEEQPEEDGVIKFCYRPPLN